MSCDRIQDGEEDTSYCSSAHDERLSCTVSMYALLASPEDYDGLVVSIKGFISAGDHPVLFVDRDSAEYSILENGIFVSTRGEIPAVTAAASVGRYVRIVGTFRHLQRQEHLLDGMGPSIHAGRLEVDFVSAEDSDAWGCSSAVAHFERSNPCRNRDARASSRSKDGARN